MVEKLAGGTAESNQRQGRDRDCDYFAGRNGTKMAKGAWLSRLSAFHSVVGENAIYPLISELFPWREIVPARVRVL